MPTDINIMYNIFIVNNLLMMALTIIPYKYCDQWCIYPSYSDITKHHAKLGRGTGLNLGVSFFIGRFHFNRTDLECRYSGDRVECVAGQNIGCCFPKMKRNKENSFRASLGKTGVRGNLSSPRSYLCRYFRHPFPAHYILWKLYSTPKQPHELPRSLSGSVLVVLTRNAWPPAGVFQDQAACYRIRWAEHVPC